MTPEENTLDNMVLHCMTAIKSDPTYKRFSNGLNIDYMNDPLSNPEITMELNIRKALKPFAEQYATQRGGGEYEVDEIWNETHERCSAKEVQYLNKRASEGWELISCGPAYIGNANIYYWKRPTKI